MNDLNLYAGAVIVAIQGARAFSAAVEAFEDLRLFPACGWALGSGATFFVAFQVWSAA